MITYTTGNLLNAKTDALVNTVNTFGVMGKGIALQFKERFKENFRVYNAKAKAKELKVGDVLVVKDHDLYWDQS
jgi:O-acetyl-ADP-ribose deacetylase (regulator of RNase III)